MHAGMQAFAAALSGGSGALPLLKILNLHNNRIGDEGMKAFAAALSGGSGALPRLESLWLTTTASAIRGCRPLPPLSAAAGRCRSSRAWTSAITRSATTGCPRSQAPSVRGRCPHSRGLWSATGTRSTLNLSLRASRETLQLLNGCDKNGLRASRHFA